MRWLLGTTVLVVISLALVAGNAQAAPGVNLTTEESTTRSAPAGGSATFSFTVTNGNVLPVDLELALKDPAPDWAPTFEPATLKLDAGASAPAKLRLAVPHGAEPASHEFQVIALDAATDVRVSDALNLTVTITPPAPPATTEPPATPRVVLRFEQGESSAPPGESAANRLLLDVENATSSPLTLRLSATLPPGWAASSLEGLPGERAYYGGKTYEFGLSLRVPAGAVPNETYAVQVLATAVDGAAPDAAAAFTLRVLPPVAATPEPEPEPAAEPPAEDPTTDTGSATTEPATGEPTAEPLPEESPALPRLLLTLDASTLDVAAGEYALGTLTVENPSDGERTVTLSGDAPGEGWLVAFESGGIITVPPHGAAVVPFSVRAPADAAPGLVATAVRADEASADLTLRVLPPTAPEADVGVQETTAPGGADAPIDVLLARYGPGPVVGAAAGVVAAAATGLWLAGAPGARRNLWWIGLGLYTRLTRPKLLDHPERERLHRTVEQNPGIHFHALQRELGWNTGALTYHLRVLERHQLLTSRRDGILRRFYLVGTAPRALPTALAPGGVEVSLSGLRGNVLNTVRERGRIAQSALAEELGASKQTLNYHVKNLERMGLIRIERIGRDTVLTPAAPDDEDDRHASAPTPALALVDGVGFGRGDEFR